MQLEELERLNKTNDKELNDLNVCAAQMYLGMLSRAGTWSSVDSMRTIAGAETVCAFTAFHTCGD